MFLFAKDPRMNPAAASSLVTFSQSAGSAGTAGTDEMDGSKEGYRLYHARYRRYMYMILRVVLGPGSLGLAGFGGGRWGMMR
jgi:hypothetical protein